MKAAKLLDRHAPEDPVVTAIELPWLFDVVITAIGAVIVAISVVASLVTDDGDDRVNLVLSAYLAVLWLAWSGRRRPAADAIPYVLAPAATVVVVELATVDRTVGVAPQFLLYLCLLALVRCVFAPRRQATLVVAATYVVLVARGLTSTEPSAALPPWLVAVTFAVAGIAGVRFGGLTIARGQQAAAEQVALDDRRRTAQQLHDAIADTLAVTMQHVTAARAAVGRSALAEAIDALEEAELHGRASLADIRRAIRVLRSDEAEPGAALAPPPTALHEAEPVP